MKVPREIDELMWEVAELDDLDTIDQFGVRYPEFRNELIKRLQMVRSLRGSRPTSATPKFVLRQNVRNLGLSKLAVAAVVMSVLASVVFATYATVQYFGANDGETTSSGGTEVVSSAPTTGSYVPVIPPYSGKPPQEPTALPPGSELPLTEFDAFQFAVTVESVDTTLVDVINEIARASGTEIFIAPGFEDAPVRLTYVDQPAIGILQELGIRFGFTPMRQGATSMIIVPALDDTVRQTVPVVGLVEQIPVGSTTEQDDDADSDGSSGEQPEVADKTVEKSGVGSRDNDGE